MQESTKTVCFGVTAAVLSLAALGNAWMNQPGKSSTDEMVGKPFYPEFVSTETARSLEVSAVDPETGALKRFGVESDGDLWRIPTEYNYPAEGAARIAQTSASVMGLVGQAIVGMSESEFEKFGVVDPLADDLEDPESAGKRVTLKDENGEPLVDYIIGNEIEEEISTRPGAEENFEDRSQAKDFYMRRADQSQTFRVSLDIDLSTKFSDWIDPDLLRINRPDVTQVAINNYKMIERGVGRFGAPAMSKIQGDQLVLTRPSPADGWNLAGMNAATEELKTDRIDEILGVLDEMQIVGVRPKSRYEGKQLLTPDLKVADLPKTEATNEALRKMQLDLMDKGFNFSGTQEQLELVSANGELEFGTSKGLLYRLNVGESYTDQDKTIEIESKDDPESETETESVDDASGESSRFLYLRVTFDESLLGDRPAEPKLPEMPTKPEGYEPAPVDERETKAETDARAEKDGEKPEGESDAKKEDELKPRKPEFIAYEEALKIFETATGEHEMNLTRFKQENEAFDKKIEAGKKLVDELNQRFGDWYYIISASNLKTIQSTRVDVVKAIEAKPETGAPMNLPPGFSLPKMPQGGATFGAPKSKDVAEPEVEDAESDAGEKPMAESDKPAADKPMAESDKPETEADKPAAEPDKPEGESEKPAAEVEKPMTESEKPATEKEKKPTAEKTEAVEDKPEADPKKEDPVKEEPPEADVSEETEKPVSGKKKVDDDADDGDS